MYVVKFSCLSNFSRNFVKVYRIYCYFLSTVLSSSSVNCSSLMSSWPLVILWIGLSVISGEILRWFSKSSFHSWSLSSLQAALNFSLDLLFLSLSSFIVCHAIRLFVFHRVSSFIDLTLNVFCFSFWYVLICSWVSACWHLLNFFYRIRMFF